MRIISLLVLICFTSMILAPPASATSFGVLLGGEDNADCSWDTAGWELSIVLGSFGLLAIASFILLWILAWGGVPLWGQFGPVCNPCALETAPDRAGKRFRVQDAIDAAGGLASGQSPSFALVTVPDSVAVSVSSIVTSCAVGTSEKRKSVLPVVPLPDVSLPDELRGWFWPGLPEDDLPTTAPAATDVSYTALYVGGVGDYPAGSGITAELTLYDATTWDVLTATGGEVCNPCIQDLNETQRRVDFVVQDLVDAAGGFQSGPIEVAASMVLSGDTSAAGATAVLARSDAANPDLVTLSCGPGAEIGVTNTATAAPAVSAGGLSLHPRQNPSSGTSQIMMRLDTQTEVDVAVFDLRGRRILRLAQHTFPAGESMLQWDGRDEQGVAVGSGVYLVRASAAGSTTVEKLLRVK